MADVAPKWANVPHEELEAYVAQSAQRPGESDEDWKVRNQMYELKLLAKYPGDNDPLSGIDAALSGEGTVTGPDENPG